MNPRTRSSRSDWRSWSATRTTSASNKNRHAGERWGGVQMGFHTFFGESDMTRIWTWGRWAALSLPVAAALFAAGVVFSQDSAFPPDDDGRIALQPPGRDGPPDGRRDDGPRGPGDRGPDGGGPRGE